MGKRRYSDDERAACLAALAANGGDVARTARETGVPDPTLRCWANGTRHPDALQMHEGKKPALADLLEDLAYRAVRTSRRGLRHLKADRAAVVAGIAIEKMQLLRGQPTERVDADVHARIESAAAAFIEPARRAIAADSAATGDRGRESADPPCSYDPAG